MDNEKNQFYFEGKTFVKKEEFWNYVKEWGNLPLDETTASNQLDILKKEVMMNIFLRGIKFKNWEFRKFLGEMLMVFVKVMDEINIESLISFELERNRIKKDTLHERMDSIRRYHIHSAGNIWFPLARAKESRK